mgnify:FL=1
MNYRKVRNRTSPSNQEETKMTKVKFTTLNEIVENGTDRGTSNKVVAVASIIKAFTKNVKMVVEGSEVWFYMKSTTDVEHSNNVTAYGVLVNLIDSEYKVGSFLWNDDVNGIPYEVVDVNFNNCVIE